MIDTLSMALYLQQSCLSEHMTDNLHEVHFCGIDTGCMRVHAILILDA